MSHTIWKFILPPEDTAQVQMPEGAQTLSVAAQYGGLCVWALVDPSAPMAPRTFHIRGTGHPIDGNEWDGRFIGTVVMAAGTLVLHVWEGS